MENTCHRCNGVLLEAQPYCPHCGAPQLTLNSYTQPLVNALETAESKAGGPAYSTGTSMTGVDWRAAVIAAAQVTGIAVVLMLVSNIVPLSFVSSLAMMWMFAAAFFSVALYHRSAPLALLTTGTGAKIGSMVGLFLSLAITAITGASLFIGRYAMQRGDELTNTMKAAMNQRYADMLQQYKAAGITDPQQLAMTKQMMDYVASPQGMATMMLTGLAMMTVAIIVFCVVMGAIGGKLLLRRQNAA